MNKKIHVIGALLFVVFTVSVSVQGYNEKIRIMVNGKEVNAEAKMIDNRVYLPVRTVSESLGAKVDWDGTNRTVSVSMQNDDELIPEVLKKVSPSVVGVIGNLKEDSEYSSGQYSEEIVHGTGVIIKPSGEILTNAHVVKDMDKIVVVLSDGNGYEAKLKCIDEETDLAVIKINKSGLSVATFGKEEDIIIGKTVLAIGTPVSISLRNSASIGIISGINRGISSSYRLIQTDAAINPGNSGGPLVNLKGNVIGINSTKFSGIGVEGLGFSIPLNTINYVLKQFDSFGMVRRPYLGANFEEDWAARVGLPSNSGLSIKGVDKNSPAQSKGLKSGDILFSINDDKVNTEVDFNEVMKKYFPGDSITVKIKRDGVMESLNIKLEEKK
jgi:serine protease Do